MNKCFITKLPSSVDNDNLPVLGQLRINWLKQSRLPDNDARAIGLATNDTITVKVSGAHFTDSTLSANNGNAKTIKSTDGLVWLYVSNDADAVLTIDGKYSLTNLNFVKPGKDGLVRSVYFDIEDIKYCTNLTALNLTYIPISGDISALSTLTNLTNLSLSGTNVSGDVASLKTLTKCSWINVTGTNVSGDPSVLSPNVLKVSGGSSKSNQKLSWSSPTARSSKTNIPLVITDGDGKGAWDFGDDLDKLLIDEAACTNYSGNSYGKSITAKGNRTSASDSAIETLQNNGWTVKIG